jgi:integrase
LAGCRVTATASPAAVRAGVNKYVGWHTFRHSLATLLVKKHEGIKVVQELMRHADSRKTLDIYAQSDDEDKTNSAAARLRAVCGR